MEDSEKIIKDANHKAWGLGLVSIAMLLFTAIILQTFHLLLP